MTMKLSPKGLAFIKHHEGLSLIPYRDVAAKWTIGYGHLMTTMELETERWVKRNGDTVTITEEEATHLLDRDTDVAENGVNDCVRVPLKQNQFDALTSFVFNVGRGNFQRSTMLSLINAGVPKEEVSKQFERWVFAGGTKHKGLIRRRHEEATLYLNKGPYAQEENLV